MAEENKVLCPDCGVEMNHHAEKLDYTAMLDESDAVDSDLGGILESAYTCPICGQTTVQRV